LNLAQAKIVRIKDLPTDFFAAMATLRPKQHSWLNGWLEPISDLIIELLKVKKKMPVYLASPCSNERLALEEVDGKLDHYYDHLFFTFIGARRTEVETT